MDGRKFHDWRAHAAAGCAPLLKRELYLYTPMSCAQIHHSQFGNTCKCRLPIVRANNPQPKQSGLFKVCQTLKRIWKLFELLLWFISFWVPIQKLTNFLVELIFLFSAGSHFERFAWLRRGLVEWVIRNHKQLFHTACFQSAFDKSKKLKMWKLGNF